MNKHTKFEELKCKVLTSIDIDKVEHEIVFTTSNNEKFKLYHDQDCCESVTIEDIIGDISDLIGEPLLMAEEVSNIATPPNRPIEYEPDSETWTFYKLATIKGSVTIRWYGESNGYYSESVDFVQLEPTE